MEKKWEDIISHIGLDAGLARLRLIVKGRVQGVGFRPGVYRFAKRAGLGGFVQNTRLGVIVEVEGSLESLNRFGVDLVENAPPLARIDHIDVEELKPSGKRDFRIEASEEPGGAEAIFPVDTAVCEDCLREMNDPGDRRSRYPFINCTNCGPRFTIIRGLPYDRPLTTMNDFAMDAFCRSQYTDPADRRFHAEPISCPQCGPRLKLIDAGCGEIQGEPVEEAKRLISGGSIVAVKGLGGYHLACLATEEEVVLRLRKRKKRPAKPFALMFRDVEVIGEYCVMGEKERRLLVSPEAPIVLLARSGRRLPDAVAPRNGYIGAFLPYTPLHHLLMEEFDVLIMTSANFTDEPLISNEEELRGILGTIADAALVHDRRVAHKCDDSIFFVPGRTVVPVRRARGFVPEPIPLPHPHGASILALGGQEKATFAVSRGGVAFLSPHLGDLGDIRSQRNYRIELEEFERILEVEPEAVVCDMHPDYFTTRLAAELSFPVTMAVQHHHAHAVSVMAEHHLEEPVVAVSFDGTGFGSDGRLWGGEFLLARYDGFERLAHMKYLPLPGGETAIREPWRMALVHLWNLFGDDVLNRDLPPGCAFDGLPAGMVLELARRGINSPMSSGVGRLFDAVANLLGCGDSVSYEAEAAVALEALALEAVGPTGHYAFDYKDGDPMVIEPAPVIEAVIEDLRKGVPAPDISAAFHKGVSNMIVDVSARLARRSGCRSVVLSGGVFQNRFLCEDLMKRSRSLPVGFYQHEIVPPNDGGVSLGQIQIGARRIAKGMV